MNLNSVLKLMGYIFVLKRQSVHRSSFDTSLGQDGIAKLYEAW
jgi:hypothetical protein